MSNIKYYIYSWFNSRNIGDILIAKQIVRLFEPICDCSFFDIGSGSPSSEAVLLPYSISNNSIKAILLKSELVRDLIGIRSLVKRSFSLPHSTSDKGVAIFAGGNSIMELSHFLGIGSVLLFLRVKAIKKMKINVAFCFSGCGPFNSLIGKQFVKKTLSAIDFLSNRDMQSYDACKELGWRHPPIIWYDPVLAYLPDIPHRSDEVISVNVFFGDKAKYHKSMHKAYYEMLNRLLIEFPEQRICLFTTDNSDSKYLNPIYDELKRNSKIERVDIKTEHDLFHLYSVSSVVIGLRMHSMITAIISGVPIVGISWQEKVTALFDMFNKNDYLISQKEFMKCPTKVVEKTENAIRCFPFEKEGINSKLEMIREKTLESVRRFCEAKEPYYV